MVVPVTLNATTKSLLDLNYLKLLKKYMYPIGLWPGDVLGEKMPIRTRIPTAMAPLLCSGYIFGGFYFMVRRHEIMDFPKMIEIMITIALAMLSWLRLWLPLLKQYHILFAMFLQDVHLVHFKDKSAYNHFIYITVEMVSKYFTRLMVFIMLFGMTVFKLGPLYRNYSNGIFASKNNNITKEFSLNFLLPFLDPQDHFYLITIENVYSSYAFVASVGLIDIYMYLMVFNMIGHIKILANDIKEIRNLGDEEIIIVGVSSRSINCKLYDTETNDLITARLKMCVDHHRFIMNLANEISDFFGPLLGINYLLHLSMCCLLLFQCSLGDPDAIFRFGVLTVYIFGQLVQTSVIFEFIGTVSEELSFEMYAVPWEHMSILNQRIVLLLLNRMQEPICIYAIGTVKVGLTTMTEILKTTFSYFMFLTSKNEIKN